MRRTEKLGLPIFDNPNEDKFGLDEWNYANQTIDEAYDEIDKIRKGIISINASAEIVEARMGKENLGDKMKEVSSLINKKANYLRKKSLQNFFETSNTNLVITGDSLSFNRYGFTTDTMHNASEHYPGLMSWSFMLRDTIHRNDMYFKSAEEIQFVYSKLVTTYNGGSVKYAFPMNGIYLGINSKDTTSSISFKYKTSRTTKDIVLYFFENSNTTACTFDIQINGTVVKNVSTKLDSGENRGFKPFQVVINNSEYELGDEVEIKISNIVAITGSTSNIYFQGVGTINRNVYLTGRGGWKSSDLLLDIQNRILKYSPDFLTLVCGANDIYYDAGVDSYKANMENIIKKTRELKPNCEILLITSTLMDDLEERTKEYNKALYELSLEYNTYFIDLVDLFSNTDKSVWRADNVHLTKYGNNVLCKEIVNLLMPNGHYKNEFINSENYVHNNEMFSSVKKGESYLITWDGTTLNKSSILGSNIYNIVDVKKVNASKIGVTFLNSLERVPRIEQFGTVGAFLLAHTMLVNKNYVEFNIMKCTSGSFASIVDSDWSGNISFAITT